MHENEKQYIINLFWTYERHVQASARNLLTWNIKSSDLDDQICIAL